MADTKLSALTAATTLDSADELYVNDSGTSKRITKANLITTLQADWTYSIDLTSEVTGVLPIANGGTGASTASAARTALGVDAAGTDNSTPVTIAAGRDYITITGQELTLGAVDLTTDVTGALPVANGGTGATTASGARTALGVDAAGTDNSTPVTLAGSLDYLTLSGQEITLGAIDLTADVTGALPAANGGTGQTSLGAVDAADFGSGAATDGYVLTADGAAGAAWERTGVISTATYSTSQTLTAAQCYGSVIYVTGAATITLPAVADGMSVTIVTVGAVAVSVDPNASDLIRLDGTALDDGDKITNTSTSGDIAVLTYYSADGWYAATNGWTDGGA